MTRYRLSPPDGRHEDGPRIIAEDGEISDRIAEWLTGIDVARPFSLEDEVHERLAATFRQLSPLETASAILRICPDAVEALLDRALLHDVLGREGHRS